MPSCVLMIIAACFPLQFADPGFSNEDYAEMFGTATPATDV
jgi:hypothetical protein